MDIACLMGLFPKEYEKIIVDDSINPINMGYNNYVVSMVHTKFI